MTKRACVDRLVLAMVAILAVGGGAVPLHAQSSRGDLAALKADVERTFDVLPLRDGLALRPRSSGGVRSVEIANGVIAIDGQVVSGGELRDKLGASADLVLRLSYLDADGRRTLFSSGASVPAPVAPPAPSVITPQPPASQPDVPRRTRRGRGRNSGDRVRVGGSVTVLEAEIVDGDVVSIGGVSRVNGEVRGDVVGVGGGVELGPRAIVTGNVVAVGGPLRRDPASRVDGNVQEVGFGDFRNTRWSAWPFFSGWGSSLFALVGVLARLAILCLLSALVMLFARQQAERAGARAMSEPLKSGAIGLLAQLLFIPVTVIAVVVLVVTLVGIPLLLLLPFAALGLALIGLVGFTGVAGRIGTIVLGRSGMSVENPYATTLAGVVIVLAPLVLARLIGVGGGVLLPAAFALRGVGLVCEYLVWTVGFGAVALARFNRPPALSPDHAQAA